MVAAIADDSAFQRARDFAGWLGLVPKQSSTGGKARLGGITKRGNTYLRRLLIHGARSFRLNGRRDGHRLGAGEQPEEEGAHERRHGGSGQQVGPGCLGGAGSR